MKKILILLFIIISVNLYSLDVNQIYSEINGLIQNKDYEKAINESKKLLLSKNKTDISNGYFYIGFCNQLMENYEKAVNNYDKSLEYNDRNYYTLEYAGLLLFNTGLDYDKGHDYLLRLHKLYTHNMSVYYTLSWYYASQKKNIKEAQKFFEIAVYYNSSDVESLKQNIAWPQTDSTMSDFESSSFYKTLINNQESLLAGIKLFYNGFYYQTNGDYKAAIEEYLEAEKVFDKVVNKDSFFHAILYSYIGEANRNLKEYDNALKILLKAKNIYENRFPCSTYLIGNIYTNIGIVYYDMGNYKKSLDNYEVSLKYFDKVYNDNNEVVARTYYSIGLAQYNLNKYEDALSNLIKADNVLKILNGNHNMPLDELYLLYGQIYFELMRYEKSLFYHKRCIEISESKNNNKALIKSYEQMSDIYHKKDDYYNALKYMISYMEMSDKEDTESKAVDYADLGYFYYENYEYKKSIESLLKSVKIFTKLKIINKNSASTYFYLSFVYNQTGDYFNSLKYAEVCLEIRKKILDKNHDDMGDIYNLIGSNYENIYKLDKSEKYYQEAMKIYQLNKNNQGLAVVNNNFATLYIKKGMHQKALEKIDNTMEFFKKTDDMDISIAATVLNNTGLVYDMLFDYKKALEYYNRALDMYKNKYGDEYPGTVTIYKNIGGVYSELGFIDDAFSYYNKALDIVQKYYEKEGYQTADIYNAMGVAFDSAGKYNESKEYFFKSLSLYKKLYGENTIIVSTIYNNLGRMFYRIGQYEKALQYQNSSINILEKYFSENIYSLATPYNTIGITYAELKDYEKALFYQNKSLDIRLKLFGENHRDVAVSYNDIGLTYTYKNEYKKALDFYNKSMNIKLKTLKKNSPSIAIGYNNIALTNLNLGNYKKAVEYYLKALEIYNAVLDKNHPNIAIAYNSLGINYFLMEDFINAKKNLFNSIQITENNRERLIGSSKAKAELFAKSHHTYKMMVSTLYHLNDYDEAFYYLEKSKSRSLLDEISKNLVFESDLVDADTKKELKNKNDLIRNYNKIIANRRKLDLNIDEEEAMLLKAEKEYNKLYNQTIKANPKLKKISESKIYKLNEVQASLDDNEVIVEYSIFDESYVFIITKKNKIMIKLNLEKEKLENYIDVYRDLLTNKSNDFYINRETGVLYSERGLKIKDKRNEDRGLKKSKLDTLDYNKVIKIINDYLYKELFLPVKPYINKNSKIKIVPDSKLSFLTFEALKNDENQYLIEIYNISYIQSCSVYLKTKNNKVSSKVDLLAFGGALYSDKKRDEELIVTLNDDQIEFYKNQLDEISKEQNDLNILYRELGYVWEDLPGTKKEIEEIGKLYYRKNSKLYKNNIIIGKSVTESKIKELDKLKILQQYKIIHFATHGLLEIEVPELSSIVLSLPTGAKNLEDGYLTLTEIMMLELDSELVTLSACETGLGKLINGEGIVGLTQSFLSAGSKNVIVSLWKVSDEATKDFMISFYKRVKNGSDYKTALKETKMEFIKGKWNKPYYWAPFVIYGE